MVKVGQKAINITNSKTMIIGTSKSEPTLGRITLKVTKNVDQGNTICTGLYIISHTCETVALGCSIIKVIPFRGRIYTGAKVTS